MQMGLMSSYKFGKIWFAMFYIFEFISNRISCMYSVDGSLICKFQPGVQWERTTHMYVREV